MLISYSISMLLSFNANILLYICHLVHPRQSALEHPTGSQILSQILSFNVILLTPNCLLMHLNTSVRPRPAALEHPTGSRRGTGELQGRVRRIEGGAGKALILYLTLYTTHYTLLIILTLYTITNTVTNTKHYY
jgi:hypothetical protein